MSRTSLVAVSGQYMNELPPHQVSGQMRASTRLGKCRQGRRQPCSDELPYQTERNAGQADETHAMQTGEFSLRHEKDRWKSRQPCQITSHAYFSTTLGSTLEVVSKTHRIRYKDPKARTWCTQFKHLRQFPMTSAYAFADNQ